MKQAVFHLIRDYYEKLTTLGEVFKPDGSHFCYALEDVVRPFGIKDKRYTAIPATSGDDTFLLRVMPSGKYGRAVTVFTHMEGDKPVLSYDGKSFTYIRIHGGNDHEDSEGCILANRFRNVTLMTAHGSMLKEWVDEIDKLTKEGYDCRLKITNKPQEE